jgi:hypothetical protein
MSGNSPTIKNKISPIIHGQLPEYVQSDHALFSTFLKHYYEFMEAAEITLGGSNDYVLQETNSVNYVLDQSEDYVVLESSTGKFINGETVVGSITKHQAKLLVEDYDNSKKLYVSSQQKFQVGENIVGQTSGASAQMIQYQANPVQNIQQLLAYADVDNTVWVFLDKFKDSFMESIPDSLAENIDQRNLIKNIRDMYEAKGTEDGHRLFFRILFDENSEFTYPRENMIKSSDGQWSDDFVMRVVEFGTSNFNELIGVRITGQTSGASAIISSLVKFKSGTTLVTELNLDKTTILGDFIIGETVSGISNVLDLEITARLSSIVGNVTITNPMQMGSYSDSSQLSGGQYYEVGDNVRFENLGSIGVRGQVSRIGSGSIDKIHIASAGTGYSTSDQLVFNEVGTNGSSVNAKIAVTGGSFVLEDLTSPDSIVQNCSDTHDIILEHTEQIILEDSTINNIYIELETSEYNNGALIAENNGTVFDRALTVNGLKLVVAGAVGGQLAVPDEWAKKTARTFELMTDPNGAGINTTHQRNFIKTLKGDAGTKHAGIPTVQRVGYGGGSTYTPNWLLDVNIASYAGLQAFNDSVAQRDMVWYRNINGNNPPTQRRDIEEIFEHIFHTIHAFGIPGAVPGSIDAVEMNPDIRIGNEPSFAWQNTALHLAMKEAIDAGLYDPSGYATDWNTDPEAAAAAYTEYTYLVNWSMWDMSVYWAGGSLSPEWDDSLKTPAGMLANNPLGYALFNTYFAPVLSKPNFATIESIFGENDTGVSGYVVDVIATGSLTQEDGTLNPTTYGDYFIGEEELERLELDNPANSYNGYLGEALILEDESKIVREESEPFSVGLEKSLDFDSKLVLENGDDIIIENATFADIATNQSVGGNHDVAMGYWNSNINTESGEITKVVVLDRGNGYTSLPSLTINSSGGGTGAELIPLSTSGVGRVLDVKITNYGLDYSAAPKITFNRKLIIKNATGNFTIGDELTSVQGNVVDWNVNTKILEIETDVEDFVEGDVIASVGGITGVVVQEDSAEATTQLEAVVRSYGDFITDRGKVSEDSMRVQDSYYYQDYSYVVRIGESINQWREAIRRSVHPAGWNVFGEVSFATSLAEAQLNSLRIQAPAAGSVGDFTGDDTFTPELASILTAIFQNIFGRRLGTTTDGTTLVSAPMKAYNELSEVPSGRELTLTSTVSVTIGTGNNIGKQQTVLGPTLDLLPKYAFAVPPIGSTAIPHYPGLYRTPRSNHNDGAYYPIAQFGQYRINQVSDALGDIPDSAYRTRINVPPPGEIQVTAGALINAFDNTFVTFDASNQTFDEDEISGAPPRQTSGSIYTSFDEDGLTLDNASNTFDIGAVPNLFDSLSISMDNNSNTFDETL